MTESRPEPAIWGIHNDTLTSELVDGSFISLGWDELGDLDRIPDGRDGIKAALAEARPEDSAKSIAGQAGVLFRFRSVIREGDVVVAPYKPDSTVNIGVITGDYYYDGAAQQHRHRRPVRWEKIGLSRTVFTQPALYELGSLLTVFRIRRHAAEFLAALRTREQDVEKVTAVVEDAVPASASPDVDADETVDEPRASGSSGTPGTSSSRSCTRASPTRPSRSSRPRCCRQSDIRRVSPGTRRTAVSMSSPIGIRWGSSLR